MNEADWILCQVYTVPDSINMLQQPVVIDLLVYWKLTFSSATFLKFDISEIVWYSSLELVEFALSDQ